jgi:translocator protein
LTDGARTAFTVAFLGVVVAYAALATVWVGADEGWYEALPKPSWQPPDVVFGVMWPLNFLALGACGVWLSRAATARQAAAILAVVAVSVLFAIGWAYLFYVPPHRLLGAAICLAFAAALTWLAVALTFRVRTWTGVLLVPYGLWLTVASSLAFGYWRLRA